MRLLALLWLSCSPLTAPETLDYAFATWDWAKGEEAFWATYPEFRAEYDARVEGLRR